MDSIIVVFPGTNREKDVAMALESAGGRKPRMAWHKETDLGSPDLIVLPGGFSYGDYLRCGAMAAHSPVMREIIRLADRGTRIMGICNGFQILVESGLLPGALLRNKNLKFICRHVNLRCENSATPFTRHMSKGDVMRVPIAHGEGNYFANAATLKALEENDQIAFRYCDENGHITADSNPNGSLSNIAGIFNKKKTVMGMMPHPEDATQMWQDNNKGISLFSSLMT